MLARSAALLLLLCLASAAAANPNCPSNLVQAGSMTLNSTDATNSAAEPGQCEFGAGYSSASYNIPAGRYSIAASVYGECSAYAHVTVQDDFRVIGLPAGTPVAILAVLHAQVTDCGTTMTDVDGHHVTIFAGYEGKNAEVSLSIAAIAEQPFRLTYDAEAFGDLQTSGSVNADFHFTGLPAGAAVVSCNGYVSPGAVAVKPASWGKLKRM